MNRDLISIIVPVYNVEAYLRKCIDCILAQTYQNFELILVDDGSPDKCPQICDDYAAIDSRIKVIHKQNAGVASARNDGLDASQGEFITFCDSDDWYEDNYLQVLYDALVSNDVDFAQVNARMVFDDGRIEIVHKALEKIEVKTPNEVINDFMQNDGAGKIDVLVWGKMFRRPLLREVRFDTRHFHEDATFICQLVSEKQPSAVIMSEVLYNYRQLPVCRSRDVSLNNFVDRYVLRAFMLKHIPDGYDAARNAQRKMAVWDTLKMLHHQDKRLPNVREIFRQRPDVLALMEEIVVSLPSAFVKSVGVNWKNVWLWRILRLHFNCGIMLMGIWAK